MRCLVLLLAVSICSTISSQEAGTYSVQLSDKEENIQAYTHALSARSLERRAKQNIPLSFSDLPINRSYVELVESKGLPIKGKSKWFNTLLVQVSNASEYEWLSAQSFVDEIKLVRSDQFFQESKISASKFDLEDQLFDYGSATGQIEMLNGEYLHFNGYTGKDMIIAIMDSGFSNADNMPAFKAIYDSNRLIDWRNFVLHNDSVFVTSTHGTRVFSVIAGVLHTDSTDYTGTAPGAKFCLYNTEESGSETPIEMFNWLMAAERADSVGADVLSTSLGYTEFDDPEDNYTYADMDGNTTIITVAADMAAEKGMLVVNSAGNSGNNPWLHIVAPSDGDSVLAVGAINSEMALADFSSLGPSSDGRVKPDVVAVGRGTALVNVDNNIAFQDGTSFSCPIISGLATCLWQAAPDKTNMEVMQAIRESAHQYTTPDDEMGYGIPDFAKAYELLTQENPFDSAAELRFRLYPNPAKTEPYLSVYSENGGPLDLIVFNSAGLKEVHSSLAINGGGIETFPLEQLSHSPAGLYFVRCTFNGVSKTFPLIRQ